MEDSVSRGGGVCVGLGPQVLRYTHGVRSSWEPSESWGTGFVYGEGRGVSDRKGVLRED